MLITFSCLPSVTWFLVFVVIGTGCFLLLPRPVFLCGVSAGGCMVICCCLKKFESWRIHLMCSHFLLKLDYFSPSWFCASASWIWLLLPGIYLFVLVVLFISLEFLLFGDFKFLFQFSFLCSDVVKDLIVFCSFSDLILQFKYSGIDFLSDCH